MTDDQQAPMEHRTVKPDPTNGVYMVLWAPAKPSPGMRSFEEVGYYRGAVKETSKGGQATTAKRNALMDPENRHLQTAVEGDGIVLRAVPAQSWPPEVKPTRYTRPAPTLEIH